MKFFLEDEGLIASTSELTLSGSSSSIQDWVSISQDSPEICVINRAFSEAHISDLPNLCPPLCFQYQPARTILDSGKNDLKYNNHASQIFEEVELLYFCQISSGAPQKHLNFTSPSSPHPKKSLHSTLTELCLPELKTFPPTLDLITYIEHFPTLL